ncbi:unnamed protein product [Rotaria socialis]|uniref:Methyltransferase domain-containing protein n=1 Tax=Rotaria socialis TaxID=392032 RepID=A0A818WQI5_9BILA|nr:unnamed protein product [Rotaria socialis]
MNDLNLTKKVKNIWSRISLDELVSAIASLEQYTDQLKDESWRLNAKAKSSSSLWALDSYSSSFLLCSLHACGSLSCSLLNHFVENLSVRAIANVACCYHLLEEKFVANPFTNYCAENDPCSFPLSHRLIEEKTKLGENARMLAVQSFERNKADQTLNAGLWYRALMQVLLVEVYGLITGLQDIELGKLTKKFVIFEEYVWKAVDELKSDKTKVPTASSYLVALFDPIKSPRRTPQRDLKVNYSEVQKDLLTEKHRAFLICYDRSHNTYEYGATNYRCMSGIY